MTTVGNGSKINWLIKSPTTGGGHMISRGLFKKALQGSRETALMIAKRQVDEHGPLILRDLFIRNRALDEKNEARQLLDQDLEDIIETIVDNPDLIRESFFDAFSYNIYEEKLAADTFELIFRGKRQMVELHDLALVYKGVLQNIPYSSGRNKLGLMLSKMIEAAYKFEIYQTDESEEEITFFLNTLLFLLEDSDDNKISPYVVLNDLELDAKTIAMMMYVIDQNITIDEDTEIGQLVNLLQSLRKLMKIVEDSKLIEAHLDEMYEEKELSILRKYEERAALANKDTMRRKQIDLAAQSSKADDKRTTPDDWDDE